MPRIIEITLAARTRAEYFTCVQVPDSFPDSEINSLVDRMWNATSGEEFVPDNDYFDRADCRGEPGKGEAEWELNDAGELKRLDKTELVEKTVLDEALSHLGEVIMKLRQYHKDFSMFDDGTAEEALQFLIRAQPEEKEWQEALDELRNENGDKEDEDE